MLSKQTLIKETILKAHSQMVNGCGNKNCLNPFCKAVSKTVNEIALECINLSKESPDCDLTKSEKFIFCEESEQSYTSEELQSMEENEIIRVFSNPAIIGRSFAVNKITEERSEID